MRAIALDIGDKRIGIATAEPPFSFAIPYQTYTRNNTDQDFLFIANLAKQKAADVIVCGMPYNSDGSSSWQTEKTKKFIQKLATFTQIKIVEEDERYTTCAAQSILLEANASRQKRKQVIDKIAASYILESYLSKQKRSKNE